MSVDLNRYLQHCNENEFSSTLPSSMLSLCGDGPPHLATYRRSDSDLAQNQTEEFSSKSSLTGSSLFSDDASECDESQAAERAEEKGSRSWFVPDDDQDSAFDKTDSEDTVAMNSDCEEADAVEEKKKSSATDYLFTAMNPSRPSDSESHHMRPCRRQLSLPAVLYNASDKRSQTADKSERRRHNSVKFADEFGEKLATCIIIPSRHDDDFYKHLSDDSDTDSEILRISTERLEIDAKRPEFPDFSWGVNPLNCFNNVSQKHRKQSHAIKYKICFDQPYKNYDNFLYFLQANAVCLESVKVFAGSKREASNEGFLGASIGCSSRDSAKRRSGEVFLCKVKVQNIDHGKTVFARCTADGWKSYIDISADYVEPKPGIATSEYDTFTFTIAKPSDIAQTLSFGEGPCKELTVEFAICYKVRDLTFWDNNNGKNYKVLWS